MQQAFGLILYINRVLCVLVWKRSLSLCFKFYFFYYHQGLLAKKTE